MYFGRYIVGFSDERSSYRRLFTYTKLQHAKEDCDRTEAGSASETSVNFCQTTWCNIPEDSHFHTRRLGNLKSKLTKAWLDVRIPSGIRNRDPSQ
jgi:hypothetical protein